MYLLGLEIGRLESRLEMRVLLDAHDPTVAHVDDSGPAAGPTGDTPGRRPIDNGERMRVGKEFARALEDA